MTTATLLEVPSVITQAHARGWHSNFFDFGKAIKKGTDFFNCSIMQRGGTRHLIVRRAEWDERDEFGYNSVLAFSLEGTRPLMGFKVNLGYQFPHEHFEDPRAIHHNGHTFISACNFIRHKRGMTYPHQTISEVDDHWQLIRRFDPVYGKNGRDAGSNMGHEKNWLWFMREGQPHLVYMACPHEVARFNLNFQFIEMFKTNWDCNIWEYGQIRGGTLPVLVDDLYYTFFHSSTPHPQARRQYHMGVYAFEAKPPFAVKRITISPLLSGSAHDGGLPAKPPVVFPCGAIYDGGVWFVTMGVNDLKSAYAYIPHQYILDEMICVEPH